MQPCVFSKINLNRGIPGIIWSWELLMTHKAQNEKYTQTQQLSFHLKLKYVRAIPHSVHNACTESLPHLHSTQADANAKIISTRSHYELHSLITPCLHVSTSFNHASVSLLRENKLSYAGILKITHHAKCQFIPNL